MGFRPGLGRRRDFGLSTIATKVGKSGLRFTNHNENRLRVGGKEWIEIYESQRKWTRSRNFKKATGEADHPSHRTFEVLRFSGPLKSAELNLQFLPLLTKRAKDLVAMKIALLRLLEEVPP